MNEFVVGIDPDANEHGVAVYRNGKLIKCQTMGAIEIVESYIKGYSISDDSSIRFSIEDVMSNKFVYGRNVKSSKAMQSKIAMSVGRCQQAQVELIRWLDHYEVKYQLHKPQKGNWAKNKEQFEKVTGWAGRSNADGRSAAFFGFLALRGDL